MALDEETLKNGIRGELVSSLRREIERSLHTALEHARAGQPMASRSVEEEVTPIAECIADSVASAVVAFLRDVRVKIPVGIPVVRRDDGTLATADPLTLRGKLE